MKLKRETQIKVIENNAALVVKDYNLPDKEFCSKTEKEMN
jgi:hypothetical protein